MKRPNPTETEGSEVEELPSAIQTSSIGVSDDKSAQNEEKIYRKI